MVVRRLTHQLEVHAPAKLNLHLEILARRPDGFHEIETLMLSLSLYDTLLFSPRSDNLLTLDCHWAPGLAARHGGSLGDIPSAERNIVYRAADLLRREAGIGKGADIQVVKRIPSQAGLGGASSDAAAALLATNAGWELNWNREQLAELAGQLGSDVPFFLSGGAAICRGRGERIESLGRVPPLHIVVVRPPEGLSTPSVYKACSVPSSPAQIGEIARAVMAGDGVGVARRLMNRLQEPAEQLSSAVLRLRGAFARTACLGHQMSGSGSSYFGICRSARDARRVAGQLEALNLGLVAWGAAGVA
jgi:4-diphosphocytidyl-2-C-methyl-D-erythritol kinase